MTIASPLLLALGLLIVAALAVGTVVLARRRTAALARLGTGSGTPRRAARQAGVWVTIAGVAVLAVAVAGPAASVPVPRASGTVVLLMDVSQSMGADDVAPSRLVAAQKAARQFIAAQPASVDIGVVAFEDGALTTAKPSPDHTVAEAAVDRLSIAGGTSLGAAIVGALSTITGKAISIGSDGPKAQLPDLGWWGSATIVMYSDGQDMGGGVDADTAARLAEESGVHIDTVGVGTTAGATVESDGFRLHTALDEEALKAISQTTGGHYHPAADAAQLDQVAKSIDLRLTVENRQLPLAGAFIALALALLAVGAVLTVARTGRVV